jgi:glycerate kinase
MLRSVVIAPDSFKGSMSAYEVADALAEGWTSVRPHDPLVLLPQADGGEGTLDALERAVPGATRRSAGLVTGPDGSEVAGEWLELPGRVAVVELAQCSGLPLMRVADPTGATTRGLGEVIRVSLDAGAYSLVIALGGSASTDGGAGALSALGLTLVDDAGNPLPDGGGALNRLHRSDARDLMPPPIGGVTLLTDVAAPLLGPTGAAAVFGPQKGATAAQVAELDAALARYAGLVGGNPRQPGAGAAGGTAFGFASLWGGRIESGAAYVARATGLPAALSGARLVLTGEGRFDAQSRDGKVVGHLIELAGTSGVRVAVIAGQTEADPAPWTLSLSELAGSVEASLANPRQWLVEAGRRAARELG